MTLEPKTVPEGAFKRWLAAAVVRLARNPFRLLPGVALFAAGYSLSLIPATTLAGAVAIKAATLVLAYASYVAAFIAAIASLPSTGAGGVQAVVLAAESYARTAGFLFLILLAWVLVLTPFTWSVSANSHGNFLFVLALPVAVGSALSPRSYMPLTQAIAIRWLVPQSEAVMLSMLALARNTHIRRWAGPLQYGFLTCAVILPPFAPAVSALVTLAANFLFTAMIAQGYHEIFHDTPDLLDRRAVPEGAGA